MTDNGVEILLVEDNPSDVKLTMYAFQRNKICNRIQVASDGAEALEFLFGAGRFQGRDLNHWPKVILLDLKLPKVDGLEVLRRIRADERTTNVPVVVLTSSSEEKDVVEAYKLRVNAYIRKPVDFEKFTEAVRTVGMFWLLLNVPPVPGDTQAPKEAG